MHDFKKNKILPKQTNAQKPADTSWQNVASWYDEMLESGKGTYQRDLILPNTLRMFAIKKGERVLDLACGQGFFSREFFKAGAKVTGVDLSKSLIDLANKNNESLSKSSEAIRFMVGDAGKLGFLETASFDAVVCVLAVQNMKNVEAVFREAARVLPRDGRLLLVMNHPAFRIPKRSSWGFDELSKVQYRRVEEYMSVSSSNISMHPGKDTGVSTLSFHRPLQFYFQALSKAGFAVSMLEEWTSNKVSQPGARAAAENKARKEFPLFLAIGGVKV